MLFVYENNEIVEKAAGELKVGDKLAQIQPRYLTEDQKHLLNKFVTNVNDTTMLREYVQKIIPNIKKQLFAEAKRIDDKVVKIKVEKLSEMLCNVENIKVIKESHILSLLRYFDLIKELKEVHA